MSDKRYTASQLRADVYRVLDRALETGVPVEIERKGRILTLVPDMASSPKLSRLSKRAYLTGDPGDIVHMDWFEHWKP